MMVPDIKLVEALSPFERIPSILFLEVIMRVR